MIELRGLKKWIACRQMRCAWLVGLTSILVIEAAQRDANAGWFSLPTRVKSKEDAVPKSTTGFSESIRKLVKEAKAQEELGNFDRAMVLAQRANKLSEDSSTVVKPASDVSPAATRKYLNELQQRKLEQTGKKNGRTPSNAQSRTPDKSTIKPKTPSSIALDEKAKPKKFAITKIDVNDSEIQKAKQSSEETPDVTSVEPPKRVAVPTRATQKVLTTGAESNSTPPKQPKVTRAAPDADADPFEEIPPEEPAKPKRLTSPVVTKQGEERNPLVEDNLTTLVTPMPRMPSKGDAGQLRDSGKSARMKLRSRYDVVDQAAVVQTAVVAEATLDQYEGPLITPMNSSVPRRETIPPLALNSADTEASPIQPIAAEVPGFAQVSTAVKEEPQEIDHSSEIPADSDVAVELAEPVEIADSTEAASNAIPDTDFPAGNVLDLKKRLDSVTSLQPGEIPASESSDLLSDAFKEFSDNFDSTELQVVRLRKQHHPFRDLPTVNPTPTTATVARQMVFGKTSMVQWRPAKDSSSTSESTDKTESKTARLPNDLRQTLTAAFEESMDRTQFSHRDGSLDRSEIGHSQITVPSLSSHSVPVRPELRGSLWDNATAPSIEGYSGSVTASNEAARYSKKSRAEMMESNAAPLPPSDPAVEQTSFDTPDELFKRRRQSKSESELMSPPPPTTTFELSLPSITEQPGAEQLADGPYENNESSEANAEADGQVETTREMLMKGPTERLAYLLGVSTSTASTLLGAAAMAMFFAGLCLVRAIVRGEKS